MYFNHVHSSLALFLSTSRNERIATVRKLYTRCICIALINYFKARFHFWKLEIKHGVYDWPHHLVNIYSAYSSFTKQGWVCVKHYPFSRWLGTHLYNINILLFIKSKGCCSGYDLVSLSIKFKLYSRWSWFFVYFLNWAWLTSKISSGVYTHKLLERKFIQAYGVLTKLITKTKVYPSYTLTMKNLTRLHCY